MKEKKIFRKPRVNGLNVPMASKKSSKGTGRSETNFRRWLSDSRTNLLSRDFEGGEAISNTTKNM